MRLAVEVFALAALLAPLSATAGPLKRLRVVEMVRLNAPLDAVWATIKDFDGLGKWQPSVATLEIVQGKNNEPGAVRIVRVKDGPTLTEQLISFDEARHSFSYKIVESPLPVDHYVATLTAKQDKQGTRLRWVGTFTRKNRAANPPEAETDAAAVKIIRVVYQRGLGNLKTLFGG